MIVTIFCCHKDLESVEKNVSRLSKASSMSTKQAAANATALKERMPSLRRMQEIERNQEELKRHQKELEWQKEQEQLQGEINAAEVLHQTLVADTTIPCNDTQSKNNSVLANTIQLNQPDNWNTKAVVSRANVMSPCVNIQPVPIWIVHAATNQASQPVSNEAMNLKASSGTTNDPVMTHSLNPSFPSFTPVSSPTQLVKHQTKKHITYENPKGYN